MVAMNEAIWCMAYGLLWWWVALTLPENAADWARSGINGESRTNAHATQGTRIARIPYRPQ